MPVSGVLANLFDYWLNLPRSGESNLPGRLTLNLGELQEILPRLALLKRIDRYNVQASMMNVSDSNVWRQPLVGMNAFDFSAPGIKECRAKFYEAVLDHPSAALLSETVRQKNGKQATVKSLYLPLADAAGDATYIISCAVYANRSSYEKINDRLVLNHQEVKELEFFDIGGGIPDMQFARPEPRSVEDNDRNWWQRFMPSMAKSTEANRLDA